MLRYEALFSTWFVSSASLDNRSPTLSHWIVAPDVVPVIKIFSLIPIFFFFFPKPSPFSSWSFHIREDPIFFLSPQDNHNGIWWNKNGLLTYISRGFYALFQSIFKNFHTETLYNKNQPETENFTPSFVFENYIWVTRSLSRFRLNLWLNCRLKCDELSWI